MVIVVVHDGPVNIFVPVVSWNVIEFRVKTERFEL